MATPSSSTQQQQQHHHHHHHHPLPRKLWEHPNPEATNMGRFRRALEERTGVRFAVSSLSDLYLDRILMVISFPRFYLRFDSCVVCCLHWFEICVLLCCSLSL